MTCTSERLARSWRRSIPLLLTVVAVAGCGGSDDSTSSTSSSAASPSSTAAPCRVEPAAPVESATAGPLDTPAFDFPAFDDLAGLMRFADAVAVGRVQAAGETEVTTIDIGDDTIRYPVTPMAFTVTRVLSGSLTAGDCLTVVVTGVPGDPVATPGTSNLLFLEAVEGVHGRYLTVGGGSGRFVVDDRGVLSPSIEAPELLVGTNVTLAGMTVDDVDRELATMVISPVPTAPPGTPGTTAPAVD